MTTDLVSLRRTFHAHAELAFTEVWTAATIRRELSALADLPGVQLRTGPAVLDPGAAARYPSTEELDAAAQRAIDAGIQPELARRVAREGTAVVLDIRGDRPGPVTAFRADIDGLPLEESDDDAHLPAREGFASIWPTMHACGHDGHAALGLGLAAALAADRDFPGTVRILFQPAEEVVRGARPMIAAGLADDVDQLIGLHLGEGLPAGDLAAGSHGLQATQKFEVTFRGVAAHAAGAPQEGRNALAAAAQATLGILAIRRDARGATTVNVGTLHAGRQSNIVPDRAELSAEVRSDSAEACDQLMERARRVVEGAALAWEVEAEVEVTGQATTLVCDDELVDRCLAAARQVRTEGTRYRSVPMPASDDLSLWAEAVQARGGQSTYAVVGASSPAPHHHSLFDLDESCLPVALAWMERIIRSGPEQPQDADAVPKPQKGAGA
ncbi:amidohydrolase [Brachybacterium hainanense]|uniref:Amidohydrolase n=1 Tax=Brachybacterium hainanense TaxID=1541174 RepID=A0ABV6RA23_9MICO